jgi:hypothetical protein
MAGDKFFRSAGTEDLDAAFFFGFATLAGFGWRRVFTAAMLILLQNIILSIRISVNCAL